MAVQPTVTQVWEKDDFTLEGGYLDNQKSSLAYTYVVKNCEDEAAACKAAWDYAPDFYKNDLLISERNRVVMENGIPKARVSAEERCGETTWKVKVEYEYSQTSTMSSGNSDEDNENSDVANGTKEVTFEASAESDMIVIPYAQRLWYRAPNAPPLPNPELIPIGWNGKDGVNSEYTGVEIQPSGIREEYKRRLDYSTIRSRNWRRRIAECRNKINKGTFKGWKPGEALFLGASYQTPQKGVKRVDVTFSFSIRTNEVDPEIAGIQLNGTFWGWNYFWAVYDDKPVLVQNGFGFGKSVKYIFCAQVCKTADFGNLGI